MTTMETEQPEGLAIELTKVQSMKSEIINMQVGFNVVGICAALNCPLCTISEHSSVIYRVD